MDANTNLYSLISKAMESNETASPPNTNGFYRSRIYTSNTSINPLVVACDPILTLIAILKTVEYPPDRNKFLEDLAHEFPGVEKAYAMQAGREVRVVVLPDQVDDDGIITLARDLTKRIESELNYP